jgi:hypothetical protein
MIMARGRDISGSTFDGNRFFGAKSASRAIQYRAG